MYPYISEELRHLYQAEREHEVAALVRERQAAHARPGRTGQDGRMMRLFSWAAAAAILAGLLVATSVAGTAAGAHPNADPTQTAVHVALHADADP